MYDALCTGVSLRAGAAMARWIAKMAQTSSTAPSSCPVKWSQRRQWAAWFVASSWSSPWAAPASSTHCAPGNTGKCLLQPHSLFCNIRQHLFDCQGRFVQANGFAPESPQSGPSVTVFSQIKVCKFLIVFRKKRLKATCLCEETARFFSWVFKSFTSRIQQGWAMKAAKLKPSSPTACLLQSADRKQSWSNNRPLPPMVSWSHRASSRLWRISPQKTPTRWENHS